MDDNQQRDAQVTQAPSQQPSGKTVLVVEDDVVFQKMYTQKLLSAGYQVLNAQDGEEALDIFKNNKVDLVICDIMMPRVSGTEFLAKMKKIPKGKNTPVIAWSNLALEEEKKQALALGANEYLIKGTLSLDEVVEKVKKYLE